MNLGQKSLSLGDTRRFEIEYEDYLCDGRTLAAGTVTASVGTNATINNVALSVDKKSLIFYVASGAVKESFTASVQVTTSDGEVVNDTASFVIS